jgi:hypothetical protein
VKAVELPPPAHDEEQSEHEQEVVRAQQDVLDAHHEERSGRPPRPRIGHDLEGGARGRQTLGLHATVQPHDAHQDVGLRGDEAVDGDARAVEAAGAREHQLLDEGLGGAQADGLAFDPAVFRQHEVEREAQVAARRDLPQHAVALSRLLTQLEVAGSRLVRVAGREPARGDEREEDEEEAHAQRVCPASSGPSEDGGGSITTS